MTTPTDKPEPGSALHTDLREAISFLSHNAREGHSSTLALLELQRIKQTPLGMAELIERVERNARKSLAAIDDFMDMVAARAQPLRIEEIDLADLLVELVADAWSLASSHGTRVQFTSDVESAPVRADRDQLSGAIAKLLRDAASRAPSGTDIQCTLSDVEGHWVIEVGDPGAPDTAPPPSETSPWDRRLPPEERVGPGYALAHVVAQRQGGWARIEPRPGAGRILKLALPHV